VKPRSVPTFTHFVVVDPVTRRARIFNLSTCEDCGCDLIAANSCQAKLDRATFAAAGMKELPALPDEGGWSEEFGGETCTACGHKHSAEGLQ
jgi:hypothetical protein